MAHHFLRLMDHSKDWLLQALDLAVELKAERAKGGVQRDSLKGKTLAMIFEKPSTRTRVSFEVAMGELGGTALVLQKQELQLGRGETVADTAKVLSRYVHAIMLRAHAHSTLQELADYAEIPVLNGLTNLHHPCQLMADLMTMREKLGGLAGKKVAWVGDGNNVCHGWMEAAMLFDFELRIATPANFAPKINMGEQKQHRFCQSAQEAADGAEVIVTDTWVSMGDDDTLSRRQSFASYQVNAALMAKAAPHAIFMHCLPAHRGDEVTDDVLDGAQSVVFDEAENRLHVQKALLLTLLQAHDR